MEQTRSNPLHRVSAFPAFTLWTPGRKSRHPLQNGRYRYAPLCPGRPYKTELQVPYQWLIFQEIPNTTDSVWNSPSVVFHTRIENGSFDRTLWHFSRFEFLSSLFKVLLAKGPRSKAATIPWGLCYPRTG